MQETDEEWPKNIVPGASEQTKNEIKKKYLKTDSLSELEATNAQSATLMAIEKFNSNVPWQFNPERFSNWKRFTRIYAWAMRFVNNCHVNEEYRTKGELTLDEIMHAVKQITKNAQYEAFHDEYVALQKGK